MNAIDARIIKIVKGWTFLPSYRSAFAYIHLPDSNAAILDIGCSTGGHCPLWRREGNRVIGVDTDKKAIEIARERHKNIDFIFLPDGSIPLPDESVDVAIMLDSIEHVQNEKDSLMEVWRVLKHGGKLILTTPYRNMFGDIIDGDNLFFIPLAKLKSGLLGKGKAFQKHRHYTSSDVLKFCSGKFSLDVEEITGGIETEFFSFLTKLLGKMIAFGDAISHGNHCFNSTLTRIQRRLKIASQNSHLRRRPPLLSNKLNIILCKHF